MRSNDSLLKSVSSIVGMMSTEKLKATSSPASKGLISVTLAGAAAVISCSVSALRTASCTVSFMTSSMIEAR